VRVAIWNNGDALPDAVRKHPVVDLVVDSGRNLGCMSRWHLAALAGAELVCCLDDDLVPADDRVIEDAVTACREECRDGIVGGFGWRGLGETTYREGEHVRASGRDEPVDIVKGRFMVLRRELLKRVPLALPQIDGPEALGFRCDDIALSLCIARGEPRRHLLPPVLAGRWIELPKGHASLDAQPAHYAIRDRAIHRFRAWIGASGLVPAGAP
jgi:hypothetical protein